MGIEQEAGKFSFQEIKKHSNDHSFSEVMHMNRHERRRLAKLNKTDKIPGVTMPTINPFRQAKKAKKKLNEASNL